MAIRSYRRERRKKGGRVSADNSLTAKFPNASAAFLRLNGFANIAPPAAVLHADNPAAASVVERRSRPRSLGAQKDEGRDSGRFLVRITSFRKRLLDQDNLCEKYHVDCCRYAGVLPDDAPEKTSIEVSQQKVKRKEEERIEIEIYRLT